jgi:hypothetical protein
MELKDLVGQPVKVRVTREPWGDAFTLHLENGYTEEFDADETRTWFKEHGITDIDGLESALDMAWNFYAHTIKIENFCIPISKHPAYEVQL